MKEEEIRPIAENYVEEYCHLPDGEYTDGSLVCAGIRTALIVSRQLEKRIDELEKGISVLLSCKNCPDNKGGYICQKEYEDKCLAQKIQYIKELQEENAELEAKIEKMKCCENCKHHYFIGDELECRLLDNGIKCDDGEKWEIKEND